MAENKTGAARLFKEDYSAVAPILYKELKSGPLAGPDPCFVPVEAPLTIEVQEVGAFTVMASPGEPLALAVGFIFSEGLITTRDDIGFLQRCEDDPSVIRIRLTRPPEGEGPSRNLIVASSCGLCGARNLEEILSGLPLVGRRLELAPETVLQAVRNMEEGQILYRETGGTHSAAVFDTQGRVVSQAEDMGRHNALDKALGRMILEGRETAGLAVALSGRVSLEMVVKSARAGLELIAAVSSPTSLALEAAGRTGVTVCGFVRGSRASAYTHPQRLTGLQDLARGDNG
jgi:FdhD protein